MQNTEYLIRVLNNSLKKYNNRGMIHSDVITGMFTSQPTDELRQGKLYFINNKDSVYMCARCEMTEINLVNLHTGALHFPEHLGSIFHPSRGLAQHVDIRDQANFKCYNITGDIIINKLKYYDKIIPGDILSDEYIVSQNHEGLYNTISLSNGNRYYHWKPYKDLMIDIGKQEVLTTIKMRR